MIFLKKKEIIIILLIALIAFIAILITNQKKDYSAEQYVVITIDKEMYKKIPFDVDTYEEIAVHTDLGNNTIIINNGSVDVVDADCPDFVCVNTKPAAQVGDMIVCLPHRLIVEISE